VRPRRESYARGVVRCGPIEVIAGLEYRDADRFIPLRDELRTLMLQTVLYLKQIEGQPDEDALARGIELALQGRWPDRAYFIEIGDDAIGWIQVFQPYGVPRNWSR